jgi:uncharacterized membrane protein
MKKLFFFWKELLATFWFIPVLIICMSILFSISLLSLDNSISIPQQGWGHFFFVNSPDSARSILSTISGAMIGVAGTVFSVTLVALTLAASQLGPRLIKNFMYVRLNQVVLGSYISTYLFCLLVLNSIQDGNENNFIPSLSILVAILAAISNIILLIVFIHQIAISIQADKVISDISNSMSKQAESLFPKKKGEDEMATVEKTDATSLISGYTMRIQVKSPKSGYLQYVDGEALMELVTRQKSVFAVHHRPGSFLVKDGEIGILHSRSNWEKDSMQELLSMFVIGKTKTSQQDLEFSIYQMVEIALRALSPGVNDPFTAIACIDNLTATMCYLAEAKFPSKHRFDKDGNLRIVADTLDFEGVLDAAFNQIRQSSGGNTAVIIKLMEALITIQKFTRHENHQNAVMQHAEMVLNLGKRSISEKYDMDDLNTRAKKILTKI